MLPTWHVLAWAALKRRLPWGHVRATTGWRRVCTREGRRRGRRGGLGVVAARGTNGQALSIRGWCRRGWVGRRGGLEVVVHVCCRRGQAGLTWRHGTRPCHPRTTVSAKFAFAATRRPFVLMWIQIVPFRQKKILAFLGEFRL